MPPEALDTPPDKPALLIIDMVKDNFVAERHLPITPLAREIIAPINRLSGEFRRLNWPVVFSTDAFDKDDFIFTEEIHQQTLALYRKNPLYPLFRVLTAGAFLELLPDSNAS